MAKRVAESTLAMRSPRGSAILYRRGEHRPRGDRTLDEAVRIVDEHLDASARDAHLVGPRFGWIARVGPGLGNVSIIETSAPGPLPSVESLIAETTV